MDEILSPVGPKPSLNLLSHLAAKAELTVAGGLCPPEALPEALPPRTCLVIMSGNTSSLYRALAPAYNQQTTLLPLITILYCSTKCNSNSSRSRPGVVHSGKKMNNPGLHWKTLIFLMTEESGAMFDTIGLNDIVTQWHQHEIWRYQYYHIILYHDI